MNDFLILLVVLSVLFGVFYWICEIIKRLKIEVYRKLFPLDQQVEMKLDREEMNVNYYHLTDQELEILEKTDKCQRVYITRKVKNDLVVTVEGEGDWTVFQASPNEISDNWVRYFRKNYFMKPIGFGKAIAFKKARI